MAIKFDFYDLVYIWFAYGYIKFVVLELVLLLLLAIYHMRMFYG